MKLEITSISIFKTWKILMIVYAIPFVIFNVVGAVSRIFLQNDKSFDFFFIKAQLLSLAISSLLLLCACIIYNISAKLFGGVEFTVKESAE